MKTSLFPRFRLSALMALGIIILGLSQPFNSIAQQRSAYDLAAWIISAAVDNDTTTINWALKEGGDIDFKRAGSNALHLAIYSKKLPMVKFLLDKGASPLIMDEDGRNPLQLAEKSGNADILQLIKNKLGVSPKLEQGRETERSQPQKSVMTNIPKEPVLAPDKAEGPVTKGAFKVGDIVLHSRDRGRTWERGTIKEISMNPMLITDNQPLYLVENKTKTSQGYFDISYLTTLERQPTWTSFFTGDWDLYLPIAATTRVIDRDLYQIISGGDRLPPLRINANGTYSWVMDKNKVIKGRWKANVNAPGIILIGGNRGVDWLMYNTSNAENRKIYKRDYIMLVSDSHYTTEHGFRIKKK